MLNEQTIDKLSALNLKGMARAFAEQLQAPHYQELSFQERVGLLVDRECTERDNRRLQRNLKASKLRAAACVEDVDFRAARGLDRALILSLAQCEWVGAHRNVLIVGPTGVGKTFIACALAQAGLRQGHTALYLRASRMLADLALARADGSLARILSAWARVEVLVIDDLGLRPTTADQAADLLEVIEDRHERRATIVTSQLPVSAWHEALGDPTLADAVLDRLHHNAYRIELSGESLRAAHAVRDPRHKAGRPARRAQAQASSDDVHEEAPNA